MNEEGKTCKLPVQASNGFPLSVHRGKGKKLIEQVYPCVFQLFFARVHFTISCIIQYIEISQIEVFSIYKWRGVKSKAIVTGTLAGSM